MGFLLTVASWIADKLKERFDIGGGQGKVIPVQSKVLVDRFVEERAERVSNGIAKEKSKAFQVVGCRCRAGYDVLCDCHLYEGVGR